MFKVEKTLSKTVIMNFNTIKEVHDWAANNRYNKSRSVKLYQDDKEITLREGSTNIYDLYSYTLNLFSNNGHSWGNL